MDPIGLYTTVLTYVHAEEVGRVLVYLAGPHDAAVDVQAMAGLPRAAPTDAAGPFSSARNPSRTARLPGYYTVCSYIVCSYMVCSYIVCSILLVVGMRSGWRPWS